MPKGTIRRTFHKTLAATDEKLSDASRNEGLRRLEAEARGWAAQQGAKVISIRVIPGYQLFNGKKSARISLILRYQVIKRS